MLMCIKEFGHVIASFDLLCTMEVITLHTPENVGLDLSLIANTYKNLV